jgi:hypothetical protein
MSTAIRFSIPNAQGTLITAVALILLVTRAGIWNKVFRHARTVAAYAEWLFSMSLVEPNPGQRLINSRSNLHAASSSSVPTAVVSPGWCFSLGIR